MSSDAYTVGMEQGGTDGLGPNSVFALKNSTGSNTLSGEAPIGTFVDVNGKVIGNQNPNDLR